MKLKRFVVDINFETKKNLKAVAAKQGKTMREIVERLVEEYIEKSNSKDSEKAA